MPSIKKARRARRDAIASVAVAPPPDFRLSKSERRARHMLAAALSASMCEMRPSGASRRRTHRARIVRFLHPEDDPAKAAQMTGRDLARDRMRRLVNEWDQSEGILSLDEMMTLAAMGLSDETKHRRGRDAYLRDTARNLDAKREEMAWNAASLEYALIWKFCEDDPELAGQATEIAGVRTRLNLTVERALRLYAAMLGQNLRARGVSPDRVVRFARTSRRPANPILPEGMSFEASKVEGWHDRSPLGRALEQGKMRVNI